MIDEDDIVSANGITAREPLQIVAVARRCHFAPVKFSGVVPPHLARARNDGGAVIPRSASVTPNRRSQAGDDLVEQNIQSNSVHGAA